MIHYEALEKLDALRGLADVKKTTLDILAFIEVARKRKELGLKNERQSNHFVFTGKPGTGKTTVARILGELMVEANVLKKPKRSSDDDYNDSIPFIEKGGADFADKYSGGAEKNMREAFEEARGGVLFIDEAYALQPPGENHSNGQAEGALTTLVQMMENYRDEVMVILAGYEDRMKKLIDWNPGLSSRISHKIHFPDYALPELIEIADSILVEKEYTISVEFERQLRLRLEQEMRRKDFSNGRTVRNLLEQAMRNQAYRLMYVDMCLDSTDPDMFMKLIPEDLDPSLKPVATA
jgi:stage V sporulation protein K